MTKRLTGTRSIMASADDVYRMLIEPQEQLKWNTLYLEASHSPPGEVRTGTVMVGNFKGSGRATVHFENVVPGREFTHASQLMMFGVPLGAFRHTYLVESEAERTRFTQTVALEPRGVGVFLAGIILRSLAKRLPESFDEFQQYAEHVPSRPVSRG